MKRVLIITYYWPPAGGSGIQRWVKFSKYLPENGWQPVVYTPENPQMIAVDHSLEGDIPNETEIIKRPISEIYGIYNKISGKKSGGGEVNPISSGRKSFKQKVALFIRGNFFIPDPRITWVRPSVRYLKKYLREHPVDAIVSTGPPHSMHLIARNLSRATGLPWVADFRDPWTRIFYYKHLGLSKCADRKQHKLEKSVLDEASAVVAVSPLVRDDFRSMTRTPVELITNGYDESDFEQVVEQDGYFNLTHTGLFAADGNPELLWKILGNKCAANPEFAKMLRIRLTGKTDKAILEAIAAAGLGDNLKDMGYQDHQVAVREQLNASVLLMILRKEPEYKAVLPGKLFEYLAASRPILGVGQPDGAMARIVHETSSGDVFDWDDEEGISSFIDSCWRDFKSGDFCDRSSGKEKYSRRATAASMARLLESVCK